MVIENYLQAMSTKNIKFLQFTGQLHLNKFTLLTANSQYVLNTKSIVIRWTFSKNLSELGNQERIFIDFIIIVICTDPFSSDFAYRKEVNHKLKNNSDANSLDFEEHIIVRNI